MAADLKYLDGKKICVVFVKEIPESPNKAKIQCMHGRADTSENKLTVITGNGAKFTVPNTALPTILPSDGTEILKDAEYFVMVKLHQDIDFITSEEHDIEC